VGRGVRINVLRGDGGFFSKNPPEKRGKNAQVKKGLIGIDNKIDIPKRILPARATLQKTLTLQ